MKIERKRQLYAWLLLSVFVPMMAVAALHVHDYGNTPDTECSACVHHQAHAGHLISAPGHIHDCVLCQLMSTAFLVATFALLPILVTQQHVLIPSLGAQLPCSTIQVHGSRAPPTE